MPKKTSDYRAWLLQSLADPRTAAGYLNAAIKDSEEAFLTALRNVAEAQKSMAGIAQDAGVNRENLYRMLSVNGNPRLETLKSVLAAMGLQISVATAKHQPVHRRVKRNTKLKRKPPPRTGMPARRAAR